MGPVDSKLPPGVEDDPAKINHERFANRKILVNAEGEETIAITVGVPSEKEYKAWLDQLTKLGNHQALLLPIGHSFERQGFCGSAGIVKLVYENYPFILSDQIHNRDCLNGKYFEETELWYLAMTILTAVHEFHSRGTKLGDVRPMNIFISKDGSVKVASVYSWPLERTNYEKSFDKETTYIAPEQVVDLAYAKTEPSGDYQLAQTFSVGLTLLDAATLGDSSVLYNNSKKIDYEGLEERLKQLHSQPYSSPLLQLITNMCQTSPQARTPVKELFQWLTPYEYAINSFAEFTPENLPAKFSKNQSNGKSEILPINSEYNPPYEPKTYVSAYNPPPPPPVPINPPPITYFTSSENIPNPNPKLNEGKAYSPPSFVVPLGQTYFPSAISESSYVPFSSKFSLEKIDEQLAQSRKNFPS